MIQSGKNFEIINERIAILRTLIKQSGLQGSFDINKTCENFVMRLLNLTYDYKLINLNEQKKNFPGLDLGDENTGITFQITSEKTSAKVDDMLTKVIRYRHYNVFPSINVFSLSGKLHTYSLKTNPSGYFSFSESANIFDFDDLLNDLKNAKPEVILRVFEFIEQELPSFLKVLQPPPQVNLQVSSLIDTEGSMARCGLSFNRHWSCKLQLNGELYSAPIIYKTMNNLLATQNSKTFLPLFNKTFLKKSISTEIRYEQSLAMDGAVNNYKESILSIGPNSIVFEFAHYSSSELMLTNFNYEVGGLLTLLLVCREIYKTKSIQIEVDIDLTSNGSLNFTTQSSIYSVRNSMVSYTLDNSIHESRVLTSTDNDALIELMEVIIHGFSSGADGFGFSEPFLEIDVVNQNIALNSLNDLLFPPDF